MTTPNIEQLESNLIDLSIEAEDSASKSSETDRRDSEFSTGNPDDAKNITSPCNQNESKSYSRLCGYLNKLGNRAILKTFRKRWFVFCESNCKLYYYRTHQDQVPLGEIDISQATFSFEVDSKERTGLFTIRLVVLL